MDCARVSPRTSWTFYRTTPPLQCLQTERNMLMTLEDYKKFVAIDDMSELADQMLLLGRTLAEGFTEYYRAANVTVLQIL